MRFLLVSYKICPYVQRVAFCLEEAGADYSARYIDPYGPKPSWFTQMAPTGKVPVLRSGDLTLHESDVILEYLNDVFGGRFLPSAPYEAARVRLQRRSVGALHAHLQQLLVARTQGDFTAAVLAVQRELVALERVAQDLLHNEWQFPTLLSFSLAPVVYVFSILERVCGTQILPTQGPVAEWTRQALSRPAFLKTVQADHLHELTRFFMEQGPFLSLQAKSYWDCTRDGSRTC